MSDAAIQVELLCRGMLDSCCYAILVGRRALIVDPGAGGEKLLPILRERNLCVEGILLTHGHFDHIYGLPALKKEWDVPVYVHTEDAPLLTDGQKNAYTTFFGRPFSVPPADVFLRDGDTIPLGGEKVCVLHTPGHTQGSVCYLCGHAVCSGDTLFACGVGRCDLYGGNEKQMAASLQKLAKLPGNLRLYPGHGAPALLKEALLYGFDDDF